MQAKRQPVSVSITEFRKHITQLTKDSTTEITLTSRGEATGVFLGIDAYRATQEMIGLLRSPEALMRSLSYHRQFQETGKPVGISLEELEKKLEKGFVNVSAV